MGDDGDMLSIDRYGASAPYPVIQKEFGFTVDNVTDMALNLVRGEVEA